MPIELANANVVIATKTADAAHPLRLSFGQARPQAVVAYADKANPTQLTAKIDDGAYPYGSMLPSARELAVEYGVAMATIHRAIELRMLERSSPFFNS